MRRWSSALVAERAVEDAKTSRREIGTEMRYDLQADWSAVQAQNRRQAGKISEAVQNARSAKEEETLRRKREHRRTNSRVKAQAKVDRAERRQESMTTIRLQEQAAKDFAARVRYETRAEIRKETRDFFQTQRDAVCTDERQKQEEDRRSRKLSMEQYMGRALEIQVEVHTIKQNASDARHMLAMKRRDEADGVRRQLKYELERKRAMEEAWKRGVKGKHDAVIELRFDPTIIRATLKEKSRRWQGAG